MPNILAFVMAGMMSGVPQSSDPPQEAEHARETRYKFDEDIVTGRLPRPEDLLIRARRDKIHPPLVRIRHHFMPELLKSADDT